MKLFTIGFSGRSAGEFFTRLRESGVRNVIDVRLYNTSQLAGYAKKHDLAYFLETIVQAGYMHLPVMAPTQIILNGYKSGAMDWQEYEKRFIELIAQRHIEESIIPAQAEESCFLCSEARPEHCHRRLVVEYLARQWEHVEICHL